MLASPWRRVLVLGLLLSGLFGLAVWYGTLEPAPSAWDLPDAEDLDRDRDRYVGERVQVRGDVVQLDPVVIHADYGVSGDVRLRIVGLDTSIPLREGIALWVYGVAEADLTVRSNNAFTVPGRGIWYTYMVSFLAGLWVLARIVRHWRFDPSSLALVRRTEPLRVRALLGGSDA